MRGHILDIRRHARTLVDEPTAEFWANDALAGGLHTAADLAFAGVWNEVTKFGRDWNTRTATIAVVSGTELYDLPDFVVQVRRVARQNADGSFTPLFPLRTLNDTFGLGQPPSLGNNPGRARWYVEGLQLGFRPPPTASWTVQVKFVPEHPDFHTGTAQAGAASTITLATSADARDGYYTGCLISIDSGTGAGQMRRISAYVGSTQVATVSAAWATAPTSASVYAIHSPVPQFALPWAIYETVLGMELKDKQYRQEIAGKAAAARKSVLQLLRRRQSMRPETVQILDSDNWG